MDEQRWAARVGWVAPGLWQLDLMQKYGFSVPSLPAQPQVLGVCRTYAAMVEWGRGPLLPGFNYVLASTPVGAAQRTRPVLAAAASLLDTVDGALVDAGAGPMLCLRHPLRLERAASHWLIGCDLGVPAEIEALALAVPRGESRSFLVGLWTAEYGYLHTGELILRVEPDRHWRASAEVGLTGEYNGVAGTTSGPFERSSLFRFDARPMPNSRWPFHHSADQY